MLHLLAARRRRTGFIARFILRGLGTPCSNPCMSLLRCREGAQWLVLRAVGSVTVRAEAWGEVACPQELGRLAHTLTRAGSPTTLWRELRTPPTWGSFLANVQVLERLEPASQLQGAQLACPGTRPPGSRPRPAGRAVAPG